MIWESSEVVKPVKKFAAHELSLRLGNHMKVSNLTLDLYLSIDRTLNLFLCKNHNKQRSRPISQDSVRNVMISLWDNLNVCFLQF